MKQSLDNLQQLLKSEELQDYLTDYLECDRVKLIIMKEGHGVYTLSVTVIDSYDDADTISYFETYEFMFTKHGRITTLLHRFSEDYEVGRKFHAITLGDKLTEYLNYRLHDESGLSEYELKNLDRRTLYPKTMIRLRHD